MVVIIEAKKSGAPLALFLGVKEGKGLHWHTRAPKTNKPPYTLFSPAEAIDQHAFNGNSVQIEE